MLFRRGRVVFFKSQHTYDGAIIVVLAARGTDGPVPLIASALNRTDGVAGDFHSVDGGRFREFAADSVQRERKMTAIHRT